ncbi:MAG: zf-HC2 domain-containing protein [Burkholderiales bacterium]
MKSLAHILGHLVSCRDVTHLISQREDRTLTSFERIKLEWHLAVCKACMAVEKQFRFMHEAMRRYRQ